MSRALIDQYLHEELDGPSQREFEVHLDTCKCCQTELDRLMGFGQLSKWLARKQDAAQGELEEIPPCDPEKLQAVLDLWQSHPPVAEDMSGKKLGRYYLSHKLGAGGSGAVYKAKDTHLDRFVAVKVLKPSNVSNNALAALREAKKAGKVDHPNLVSVYDAYEDEDKPFLVMELVEGATLHARLQDRPLAMTDAAAIVEQVAAGLTALHKAKMWHLDIKLDNLLISDDGHVTVVDFDIAQEAADGRARGGTYEYMSPEQISGQPVDGRSDIFSLGVVLYRLMTGHLPFQGNFERLRKRITTKDPLAPRKLNDAISKPFQAIMMKCLEKDPGRRYQEAAELVQDLQDCLANRPIQAKPSGWVERNIVMRAKRNKIASAVLAVLTLTIAFSTWKFVEDYFHIKHLNGVYQLNYRVARNAWNAMTQAVTGRQQTLSLSRLIPHYEEWLAHYDPLIHDKSEAGEAHFRLAHIFALLGHNQDAQTHLKQTDEIFADLLRRPADRLSPTLRRLLATYLVDRVEIASRLKQPVDAVKSFQRAILLGKEQLNSQTATTEDVHLLVLTIQNYGAWLQKNDRATEAREHYNTAIQILRQLSAESRSGRSTRHQLAGVYLNLGKLDAASGALLKAVKHFETAASIWKKDLVHDANAIACLQGLASTYHDLGAARFRSQPLEADDYFQRSQAASRRLAELQPLVVDHAVMLAKTCLMRGRLKQDRPALALQQFRLGTDVLYAAWLRNKDHQEVNRLLQQTLRHSSNLFGFAKLPPHLFAGRYRRAAELTEQLVAVNPQADTPEMKLHRATMWAKAMDSRRSLALAAPLRKPFQGQGEEQYNLACIYSRAVQAQFLMADTEDQVEQNSRIMMALLRDSATIQFLKLHPDQLVGDVDFQWLREQTSKGDLSTRYARLQTEFQKVRDLVQK